MSDTLKQEIIDFLYSDGIDFRATFTHKGIELEIFYSPRDRVEEIHEVIEDWICYGDFFNFLFKTGSYYNFEGEITSIESGEGEEYEIVDLEIDVEIKGPNIEENGLIIIDFINSTIISDLKLNPEAYGLSEFDNSKFYVDFYIIEWELNSLELNYTIENNDVNDLTIGLDENQKSTLSNFIFSLAKNHIPTLNIDFEAQNKGYHSLNVEGIHNKLYYERIDYFKFRWNDIYPDTN